MVWIALIVMFGFWVWRQQDPDLRGNGYQIVNEIRAEMNSLPTPQSARVDGADIEKYKNSFVDVQRNFLTDGPVGADLLEDYRKSLLSSGWTLLSEAPAANGGLWACKSGTALYLLQGDKSYSIRINWSWVEQRETCKASIR